MLVPPTKSIHDPHLEEAARRLGLEPLGRAGWFNGPCSREGCEDKDESFYLFPPAVITVTAAGVPVMWQT
jgi:hypothetical protein